MKEIQTLLNHVSIIAKKNAELLDATGGRFNIFRILGVDHYENIHSRILAELLNPKGSHGLKNEFLILFVERLVKKDKISGFHCENASVRTEAGTDDGRIDIFIEDNQSHAIIIENKIYAADRGGQLKGYNAFALKHYGAGNYQILYLTLGGKEATENSRQDVKYERISYSIDIIGWLEDCVNISARHPLIRETIIQYINHLKLLTNIDMDSKNSKEIVELLSKHDNLDAAFIIYKNYSGFCEFVIDDIIQKSLKPQMEVFASENHLVIHTLKGTEKGVTIIFEKSTWEKCRMLINTEGSNLYGFQYKNHELKIDRTKIEDIKKSVLKSNTSEGWPIWARTDNFKYINMDVWNKEIRSGEFGDYVIKLFSKLLKSVEGIDI